MNYTYLITQYGTGDIIAEVVELQGCLAFGDTANEALDNIKEAAENWVAAAKEQGQTLPTH